VTYVGHGRTCLAQAPTRLIVDHRIRSSEKFWISSVHAVGRRAWEAIGVTDRQQAGSGITYDSPARRKQVRSHKPRSGVAGGSICSKLTSEREMDI
jgi:hypothetical protein